MLFMITLSHECFNTLVAIERPYLSVCLHLNLKTWCVCNVYTSEGMVTRAEWKKDQNCKLQFPQPDYWPRHSPDFRTDWAIFLLWNWQNVRCKQTIKQKLKFSISTTRFGPTSQQWTSFVLYILWWSPSSFCETWVFSGTKNAKKPYIKWEKSRKPLSIGWKWADYLPCYHVTDLFQNSSHTIVSFTRGAFSGMRKSSESGFFSLSNFTTLQ